MRVRRITSALDAELQALLDLHAAKTLKEFWRSARRLLRSAVPAATIWFAPAVEWALPSATFREETTLKTQSQVQRFQEHHPLQAFLRANPQKHLATFSDVMTDAQLLRSGFYREFMAPQHERFSVVLAFRHRTLLRALIGLNRLQNDRDFSRAELRILGSLHRHLGRALNSVWELQREQSTRAALELVLAPLPLPIVVLDWELDVLFYNAAARESCAAWNGCTRMEARRFDVPGQVRTVCHQLKAAWNRADLRMRRSSVNGHVEIIDPTLSGFRASVRLVHPDSARFGMPLFLVTFEDKQRFAPISIAGAGNFSQLARLSIREREVASLVCKGESNKEVAAQLGTSVLTVKTQLQSIYEKLGIAGRGRLNSLLQDRNGSRV